MMKISILILSFFVLFSFKSIAAFKQEPNKVFSFEQDTLSDLEKFENALQFCRDNKRNICITVDDNLFNRVVLKKTALGLKHAVFEFKTGDDLLSALRHHDLALVLVPNAREVVLDNQMPGTFGVDVMTIIKQERLLHFDEGRREVPVILNTDAPLDVRQTSEDKFAKISPRKNDKQVIIEVDEEINSPLSSPSLTRSVVH